MKTDLKRTIKSEADVKEYLSELFANGEMYHLEDCASEVVWQSGEHPTNEEILRLNGLACKCFEYMEDPLEYALGLINPPITPTKSRPVFTATNNWFGRIETSLYKDWEVRMPDKSILCGCTFATTYADAITRLHEWIIENSFIVKEYPKAIFSIEAIDGSFDKHGEVKYKVVYQISAAKAKKYLL